MRFRCFLVELCDFADLPGRFMLFLSSQGEQQPAYGCIWIGLEYDWWLVEL